MKLLFHYLNRYKGLLTAALVLATVNQIFSLLDPQIFRLIIDNYATKINQLSQNQFAGGVLLLLLAAVGVALVSRIAKNFQDYFVNVITQKVGTKLYADAITHSFSLPYAIFEDQRSGELLQKVQKAKIDTQALISSAVNIAFLFIVGLSFVIVYAFIVHWLIGLVYILIVPVLGIITFVVSKRIESAQRKIVRQSADLAGATTETLRNVELVKSLGLENQETQRLNMVNLEILKLELKKITLIRTLSFIQGTMINVTRSALMFLMLWLIFQRQITLGEFFSLLFYSFAVFSPLYELSDVASQYQQAKASLKVLDDILKQPTAPKPKNPKKINSLKNITFKNTSFNYQLIGAQAVKELDLEIKNGQTVAFVGPSGSGKSTLIKLLVGLYQPTNGQLLINGISSAEIDFDDLRQKIGYVSQETQLFAGTIKENLLFVNPQATDQDCLNALRAAAVENVLKRGGWGLENRIGEGGIKLSGGERQRLAIARALLRQPQLIIFDEATSNLDSITEKSITQTIQQISQNQTNLTTILVAHRLSTVAHANVIYVLEKGKVIESGNHEKLLKNGGLYAALWREQSAQNNNHQ
jgi:ATP-binding cassette subfamily B protein